MNVSLMCKYEPEPDYEEYIRLLDKVNKSKNKIQTIMVQ